MSWSSPVVHRSLRLCDCGVGVAIGKAVGYSWRSLTGRWRSESGEGQTSCDELKANN